MKASSVCGGCGARMPSGAVVCDLCGWNADEDTAELPRFENPAVTDSAVTDGHTVADETVVEAASESAESDVVARDAPAARTAVLVALGAALLVAGLYLVTVISRSAPVDPPTTARTADVPPPFDGPARADSDALIEQIAEAEGLDRIELQRALIGLYVRNQRLDLAAGVQEAIAHTVDSEIEWVRSGNLYYDCMELQTGALRTSYARKAIFSYQRALQINPDNLDARTDMALAYFYDPEQPMQAIQNINQVLEADSTHIQANYNRGYLLFQIGRYEQAIEQFGMVMRLVSDPTDPIYVRAQSAIEAVRQRMPAP